MKGLTQRQNEILQFLRNHFHEKGYWPSIREIQKNFEFKSTNAVMGHLKALENKGVLDRIPGHARAFKINEIQRAKRGPKPKAEKPVAPIEEFIPESSVITIPIYGSIAAGYPDYVESRGAIGSLQLDLTVSGVRNQQNSFALKVRGESMINAGIYDGDIVIIENTGPNNQDIVAALIDRETTLKRFIFEDGSAPYLKAENPEYPSLHPANELVIQGVARSIVRNL